ncbi:hypothetical protein ACM66B_003661 [Microbotryomycetes sp. NB124-2]
MQSYTAEPAIRRTLVGFRSTAATASVFTQTARRLPGTAPARGTVKRALEAAQASATAATVVVVDATAFISDDSAPTEPATKRQRQTLSGTPASDAIRTTLETGPALANGVGSSSSAHEFDSTSVDVLDEEFSAVHDRWHIKPVPLYTHSASNAVPSMSVSFANEILPALPADLADRVPPAVIDATSYDGECSTFGTHASATAFSEFLLGNLHTKTPLPTFATPDEALAAGFEDPTFFDRSCTPVRLVSACRKDGLTEMRVMQSSTAAGNGTIIDMIVNALNLRADRVVWSTYRITAEFVEWLLLSSLLRPFFSRRLQHPAVQLHFNIPRDQIKIVYALQMAEAFQQGQNLLLASAQDCETVDTSPLITWTIIQPSSPDTKLHAKDIVFTDYETRALYTVTTSANASITGMGMKILKGKGHANMSEESATLSPLPIASTKAEADIASWDRDFRGKVDARHIIALRDCNTDEDRAIKTAREVSNLHYAKLLRQLKVARDSLHQNVATGQKQASTVAPAHGVGLKFLDASVIDTVKSERLKLASQPGSIEAAEAKRRVREEMGKVGDKVTVLCLGCSTAFKATLKKGLGNASPLTRLVNHPRKREAACRLNLSIGASGCIVDPGRIQAAQKELKGSETRLGAIGSYDLLLKWFDGLECTLVGTQAIVSSLRAFLQRFKRHSQYNYLFFQTFDWQSLSTSLSRKLGKLAYLGNATTGYETVGASVVPSQKHTVHGQRKLLLEPAREGDDLDIDDCGFQLGASGRASRRGTKLEDAAVMERELALANEDEGMFDMDSL